MSRGETSEGLSKRTGVRIDWIRAIEAGQFQELPPGIYGRSAIRAHANALGLDAAQVLAACATLLTPVEDPIAAMRRLNGVATCDTPVVPLERPQGALPDWRLIAASVIDAGAMAFTLLVVITSTVAMGLPISALDRSAGGPIFLVTFVLTACYFVFFGGIVGRTAGEYMTGMQTSPEPALLDLRAVAIRTRQSIFRDSHFIELLGEWIGRRTVGGWHWLIAHAQK
jgi:Helix-turn-helix domain